MPWSHQAKAPLDSIFGEVALPAFLADAAERVLEAGASPSILDRCVGAVPIGRLVFIAAREALMMGGRRFGGCTAANTSVRYSPNF